MEKKMLQWYGEQIDIIDNLYEFLSKREDDDEILEFIWENKNIKIKGRYLEQSESNYNSEYAEGYFDNIKEIGFEGYIYEVLSEVKDEWLDENFIGRDSEGMITAFISVYYYPNEIRNLKNQIIWNSNELDEEDKQLVDDTHRRIMENIKIGEKYLKFLLKIKNKKIQENSDIKEWMKTNEKIGKQYLEYLNSLGKLKNEIEKMKIEGE